MVYFQQPGAADAELAADMPATFRRLLYATSGSAPPLAPVPPPGSSFLDMCPEPSALPPWLTETDIKVFALEYASTGVTGPLNWYRNLDRNWALTAPWHGARITTPALFISGERDFASDMSDPEQAARLRQAVPGLREVVLLPGCGHWTQQESPAEVSEALARFAWSLT